MTRDEVSVVYKFVQTQDWLSRRALGDIIEESGYPQLAVEIRDARMWEVRVFDGEYKYIMLLTMLCEVGRLKEVIINGIKRQCHEYGKIFPFQAECTSLELKNGLFVADALRAGYKLTKEDFA